MPVMDGIELLKQVKKESPETVVILLTAFEEFDLAREALRHGC
ncbi:MAG: response regulator [Lachnospiraceae bacterium]